MIPKLSALIFLSFLFTLICGYTMADHQKEDFEIGDDVYSIPKRYILPDLPKIMPPSKENMDTGGGVLLKIPLADIGIALSPGENNINNSAGLHISPVSDLTNPDTLLNPGAIEAWTGSGLFEKRGIELDRKVGLYRVFPERIPEYWNYFREAPAEGRDAESAWVASCKVSTGREEAADRSNVDCSTSVRSGNAVIGISFPGRFIEQVDIIRNNIKEKIELWKIERQN